MKDKGELHGTEAIAVLGVTIGEDRYLVPMVEVSEVITIPSKLTKVPLTQPWFVGLINVRGNLYNIIDSSIYLDCHLLPYSVKSRILLVSSDNKLQSGFVVNSMLGIRNLTEFIPEKLPKKRSMQGTDAQYKDSDGRLWRKLSLLALMNDERFMQIARA